LLNPMVWSIMESSPSSLVHLHPNDLVARKFANEKLFERRLPGVVSSNPQLAWSQFYDVDGTRTVSMFSLSAWVERQQICGSDRAN